MTDANGIPLGVVIAGANVPDMKLLASTLDAVVLRASQGPRRRKHLCLDKGYDFAACERDIRKRRITPHSRRRGEPPLPGCVRDRPRRWGERINSWHNSFRALKVRREVKGCNHLALVQLACALIAFDRAL